LKNTDEYVAKMSSRSCISDIQEGTLSFESELGKMLSGMADSYELIK